MTTKLAFIVTVNKNNQIRTDKSQFLYWIFNMYPLQQYVHASAF